MKALLTAVLTSHLIGDPPPIGLKDWRLIRPLVEQGNEAEDLRASIPSLGLSEPERALERLEHLANVQDELEKLASAEIEAVSQFDSAYPAAWLRRLDERCPPLVFVAGNQQLLQEPSIGVVGSRDVDDAGVAFAQDLAREIAEGGFVLVSGGARGVDANAMCAAIEAGGRVLGIRGDSLAKGCRDASVIDWIEDGRLCLCTPYSPYAPFSVGNAMGRNKLIYGHAEATVVVSSDRESGGTWAGATEALRLGLGKVLVRLAEEVPVGNRELVKRGAHGIEAANSLWKSLEETEEIQSSLF